MTSFANSLTGSDKAFIRRIRAIILNQDKAVTEKSGKIMSADNALCYLEQGVMKYGLARTAKGFTFHSMVMYANPEIYDFAKSSLGPVKMQKGCVNIKSLETLDFKGFEEFLTLSAAKDFGPVIEHYKTKIKTRKA